MLVAGGYGRNRGRGRAASSAARWRGYFSNPRRRSREGAGRAPLEVELGGQRSYRANASTKSHAELDEATELDKGDPADLAERHAALRARLPHVNVLDGCCGTDHRHITSICAAWRAGAPART
ncbi:MAG TPA: hypothetical protein VES61_02840 [Gaiellaceae bacterium]|nr:hypothetical protein [Gaiellaceae bacterium]